MTQEIDDILNFNMGNIIVYNKLCGDIMHSSETNGWIMPFIGDGLSEFAFGVKESFIDDVLNIITESLAQEKEAELKERVKTNDFLESLENLKNELGGVYGEALINQHLGTFYSDDKIDEYLLENQAVSLVPLLSNGDSITINFDHVLELAYKLVGINPVIATPYDCNILNSKIRGRQGINKALLFKIHGDIIISNATERIITKAAFEKNYKKNAKLVKNLTKWIQKYRLLFIGVDLLKDKYLRGIFEETRSEGINHYAIVGCEDKEETKKSIREQLSELNILPIIYDAKKQKSVETILHKILVDTKSELLLRTSKRGEYYYRYSEHDLVGRENELKKLQEFLECNTNTNFDFKWWMIWGKDIVGKSKLAYDFARNYAFNWDWYMLNPGQIDGFLSRNIEIFKNRNKNIFIIFDDFDCYSGEISNILDFVGKIQSCCPKVRILFIVRDKEATQIGKIIYDRKRNDNIRAILLKTLFAAPREIKQLSVKDIKQICYKYILYRKKELGLDDLKESDFLKIDSELEQYIKELLEEGESLLLLCCLEKAISLILDSLYNPSDILSNKEIIHKVMRYILTEGENNFGNPNVDILEIDKRKEKRKEQGIKLLEKYDTEKEFEQTYFDRSYVHDEFISKDEKE